MTIEKIKKSFKQILYTVINDVILKPLNLKLSFRIGNNVTEDIVRLLKDFEVLTIVDGGAYKGTFSTEMAKLYPDAVVYAFEPQVDSYNLLLDSVKKISNIKTFQCALGANTGEFDLHTNISPLTNSLSKSSYEAMKYFKEFNEQKGVEKVKVVTLEKVLEKENINNIDLLKLDLQGFEKQALEGMGGLINSTKLIYSEVEFVKLYNDASLFSELEIYLKENGFIFYQFYDLVRSPKDGRLLYGDAIFLNQKYIDITK